MTLLKSRIHSSVLVHVSRVLAVGEISLHYFSCMPIWASTFLPIWGLHLNLSFLLTLRSIHVPIKFWGAVSSTVRRKGRVWLTYFYRFRRKVLNLALFQLSRRKKVWNLSEWDIFQVCLPFLQKQTCNILISNNIFSITFHY